MSRRKYGTECFDRINFSTVGFLIVLKSEMEHSHEDSPPFFSQPQVQGAVATGIFFADKRRHFMCYSLRR